jgi:tetratricopeptide (TPR) repeat protein
MAACYVRLEKNTESASIDTELLQLFTANPALKIESENEYVTWLHQCATSPSALAEIGVAIKQLLASRMNRFGTDDPFRPMLLRALTFIVLDQGNADEALRTIDQALESANNAWPTPGALHRRIEIARAEVLSHLDRSPESVEIMRRLADDALAAGRNVEAAHLLLNLGTYELTIARFDNAAATALRAWKLSSAEFSQDSEKEMFFHANYLFALSASVPQRGLAAIKALAEKRAAPIKRQLKTMCTATSVQIEACKKILQL